MSLQAHKLGVAFDGNWIFRGASLNIEPSQRISLVGPSGSGKSLFLKSLAMLHPVNEGDIEWRGHPIAASAVPAFRSQVMYVPQRIADVDGTVEDFLSTPFSFASHADRTFDRSVVLAHFQHLGRSNEFLTKSQRDLSGGERQVAALVRALILNPSILLLDEPTSAMDGETSSAAESLVDAWCNADAIRSTVWVTHDPTQARRVSEKVVEFDKVGDRPILGS